MKRERLFRILGLIDDGLIEEASSVFTSAPPRKQRFWMPALAAAACLPRWRLLPRTLRRSSCLK